MTPDYYGILGVSENASEDEIKRSYRSLAMKYHPDRNPGDSSAEAKFKEVSEAYDNLSDPKKRERYDYMKKYGVDPSPPRGGYGPSRPVDDIFREFFRNDRVNKSGIDIQVSATCTLEESVNGCKKHIEFETNEICSTCKGSGMKDGAKKSKCRKCQGQGRVVQVHSMGPGQVMQMVSECDVCRGTGESSSGADSCPDCRDGLKSKNIAIDIDIPKNFVFGTAMRLGSQGLHSNSESEKGDCYVRFMPEKHELFDLNGYDTVCNLYITASEAILGTKIGIPLLDGGTGELNIPSGSNNGDQFIMGGQGLYKRGGGRGNSIVFINVETPKPNPEITKLAKKMQEEENADNTPRATAFRKKLAKFTKKEKKHA
jgi:molecular chaperone DnaJ